MFIKLLISILIFSSQANAIDQLDSVIVSSNKVATPLSGETSSAVLIESEEITEKYQGSLIKALKSVSGVDIFSQGGVGRNTSLFLRGANSEHVLVLIDGVKVNDPISPTRAFDFARLNATAVERIEIIKGSQSVLYGSDALAGVVHIITKRGQGITQKEFNLEYGSFETKKMGGSYSGRLGNLLVSSFVNLIHNEGFSVAPAADNEENDGYRQADIALNLDYKISEATKSGLGIKQVLARTELDYRGGLGGDDPNLVEKTSQTTINTYVNHKLNALSDLSFKLDYNSFERQNRDLPNSGDPEDEKDFFKGQKVQADLLYTKKFLKNNHFSFGLNYELEVGETNKFKKVDAHTTGIFAQTRSEWGNFINNLGLRYDKHSRGDVESLTFRVAPGYIIKSTQTKLRASVGSGFKSPSLFNLFDPVVGNPNLKPEESVNYELGMDQELFGGYSKLSATYFVSEYKELFFFDPLNSFKAFNLERALVEGLEVSVSTEVSSKLSFDLSYNYLFKAENTTNDEKLIRRPKNSWSINTNYKFTHKFSMNLNFRQQGSRQDFDAITFDVKKLSSFDRFDLSLSYDFSRRINCYLHIENLLNDQTQQIDGYNEAGFAVYSGLNFQL